MPNLRIPKKFMCCVNCDTERLRKTGPNEF